MLDFKIMTTEEIYNLLIDYNNKENPFHKIDKIRDNLKYFSLNESYGEKNYFFIALKNKKIVGYLKLKTEGTESMCYPTFKNWICAFSVIEQCRGQGIAKKLIEQCFVFLKEKNLNHLLQSGYTKDGYKLRNFFLNMSLKYKINFLDKDKVEF